MPAVLTFSGVVNEIAGIKIATWSSWRHRSEAWSRD